MADRLVLHTRVVTGSGGGPDKTILNSPRFLRDEGYPMLCVYMRPPGDPYFPELERRAAAWEAPLLAVDDNGPLDWKLYHRLLAICEEHRPAIWHGHDYKSNLLGLLVARRFPMALVTTVHGWVKHTWKTPLYYAIDRLCLPHYEAVICVSEDLVEQVGKLGVPADRLFHVANAIDTEDFQRHCPRADVKERLGTPPERVLIGAIGRLSDEKRFDLLIRSVARLIGEGRDVALWIAGEGDQQPVLANLIRELGVAERVRLLGFRSDTKELYEAMDLFALSSVREGLPNVLLEAMAMEAPVLATRIAGIPHLVDDGVTGLLVEPDDLEGLTDGLRRMLDDEGLRRDLARAARRRIEERHSFRARMNKIRAIYEKTMQRREGNASHAAEH